VLDAFCPSGGFTVAALAGGAKSTLSIDSSADALALARSSLAQNPALDAKADAALIMRTGASADHPVALNFPEGAYLEGMLILKR
jgi:23S rRNA G2069 N7-methylase RlmK/C1962 C5-methylase RlmI